MVYSYFAVITLKVVHFFVKIDLLVDKPPIPNNQQSTKVLDTPQQKIN